MMDSNELLLIQERDYYKAKAVKLSKTLQNAQKDISALKKHYITLDQANKTQESHLSTAHTDMGQLQEQLAKESLKADRLQNQINVLTCSLEFERQRNLDEANKSIQIHKQLDGYKQQMNTVKVQMNKVNKDNQTKELCLYAQASQIECLLDEKKELENTNSVTERKYNDDLNEIEKKYKNEVKSLTMKYDDDKKHQINQQNEATNAIKDIEARFDTYRNNKEAEIYDLLTQNDIYKNDKLRLERQIQTMINDEREILQTRSINDNNNNNLNNNSYNNNLNNYDHNNDDIPINNDYRTRIETKLKFVLEEIQESQTTQRFSPARVSILYSYIQQVIRFIYDMEESYNTEIKKSNQEVFDIKSQRKNLLSHLKKYSSFYEETVKKEKERKNKYNEAKEMMRELKKQLNIQETTIQELLNERNTLLDKDINNKNDLNKLEAKNEDLINELNCLKDQVDMKGDNLKHLNKEYKQCKELLEESLRKVHSLSQQDVQNKMMIDRWKYKYDNIAQYINSTARI